MLSLDNSKYSIPTRQRNGWIIKSLLGDDYITATQFAFTFKRGCSYQGNNYEGRLTFIYDGVSVKASPRTLRLFGAKELGPLISALSRAKDRSAPSSTADSTAETQSSSDKTSLTVNDIMIELQRCKCIRDLEEVRKRFAPDGQWPQICEVYYKQKKAKLPVWTFE